jgi:ABC-type phosphate/phosphonate transport system ATPase subunit
VAPDRFTSFIRRLEVHDRDVIEKKDFILIEGTMGSGKSKLLRNIISHYTLPEVFKEKNLLHVFFTYKDLMTNSKEI